MAFGHLDADVRGELVRAGDGPITVDVTTIGRTSGLPRRIEIWIVRIGDRVIMCGTPGRRDWLANLRADPALTLHLKENGVSADVSATAIEVDDPGFRREIWEHLATHWYRTQTPVEDLIATAPTVELTFR